MPFLDLTTLLSIALLVYAWWPGTGGRNRWTGRLVALVLLSPGLRYLSALFTFPIRLQLSAWAGDLLRLTGMHVQVEGNVIIKTIPNAGPVEMAVDPACMGLQLTGVSLLVGLFALIWQERIQQRQVAFGWVALYMATVFGLTIGCNLFRIVLLVAFGALPGSWAHEGIGLACVAIYAWLPAWLLAQLLVQWLGLLESPNVSTKPTGTMLTSAGWGFGILAIGISIRIFTGLSGQPIAASGASASMAPAYWPEQRKDCRCKTLANGFVQCTKPGVLLYLKPQPDWFSADHSPMVCWQGSGYDLRRVRETILNGHRAYIGELHKKGRVLHTAWWFSNGAITTISQLTMRGQMLRGETGFVLVNVNADQPFLPDGHRYPVYSRLIHSTKN